MSSSYQPGETYYGAFSVMSPTTGGSADADSLPTCTASKNGTDDATFTLTVAHLGSPGSGRYSVSGTVPITYAVGDRVSIWAVATVDSVQTGGLIDAFMADVRINTPRGTVISASSTEIVASGLGAGASYRGQRMRVISGTAKDTEGTITGDSYSAPNHTLTFSTVLGAVPSAGDQITCG